MNDERLLVQRYLLSLYIQARNEAEGLTTPEARWAALGRRMKAAKEAERARRLREGRKAWKEARVSDETSHGL